MLLLLLIGGVRDRPDMQNGRWLGLVSALWVQCISGNNYTFSNYSVALKAILGINQVELNNLGVAKDIGKAFGVVGGLLADVLPPWSIFLIGSLLGLIGYGSQWLVISQRIASPPLWLMSIIMCLGGNSTTWMNTAVLVTCVKNFRRNRGPVSGILKGYVGLSTAIFTDIAVALFASDPAKFVLMLAVIPLAVCTIAMFLLRPVESTLPWNEQADKQETRYFSFLNAIAIILAFYLLAYDITGTHSIGVSRVFAAGLLLLLAAPVCLPAFLWWKTAQTSHNFPSWQSVFAPSRSKGETSTTPLLPNNNPIGEEIQQVLDKNNKDVEKCVVSTVVSDTKTGLRDVKRKPKIGEDHNILQAISTVDFWLLFFTFLCGIGTGMAVLNNLGQIAQSLGYTSAAAFISLNSIFGFFGRLGSGAVSEFGIRSAGLPRLTLVAASQLLMIVGYVVLALGLPGGLYIGSIVIGLCYGVRMAVSVACASELFGLQIFGLVYNLLILNLPLGSFLFSGLLAGYLYDREAMKASVGPVFTPSFNYNNNSTWMMGGMVGQEKLWHGDLLTGLAGAGARAIGTESDGTCLGVHCYRLVFITMGGVSILGFILDVILTLRTRPIYAAARRKSRWPSSSSSSSSS